MNCKSMPLSIEAHHILVSLISVAVLSCCTGCPQPNTSTFTTTLGSPMAWVIGTSDETPNDGKIISHAKLLNTAGGPGHTLWNITTQLDRSASRIAVPFTRTTPTLLYYVGHNNGSSAPCAFLSGPSSAGYTSSLAYAAIQGITKTYNFVFINGCSSASQPCQSDINNVFQANGQPFAAVGWPTSTVHLVNLEFATEFFTQCQLGITVAAAVGPANTKIQPLWRGPMLAPDGNIIHSCPQAIAFGPNAATMKL